VSELIKCLRGEEFPEGPNFFNYVQLFLTTSKKYFSKGGKKFSCAPDLRACLLGGRLCPSPYTFLARQSHFSNLTQKCFAQWKEMTFDRRLKTLGLQLFSVYIALLSKFDLKNLHEITVNSQG